MASIARPPPVLNVPDSASTVNVQIIDTTSRIKGIPVSLFVTPEYKGFDYLDCPEPIESDLDVPGSLACRLSISDLISISSQQTLLHLPQPALDGHGHS